VGYSVGSLYSAITFLTILCVAGASLHGLRWTLADSVVAAFCILVGGAFVLHGVTLGHLVTAVSAWVIPYAWGRVVVARVGISVITSLLAAAAVVAAALAIVEFLTHLNVFSLLRWPSASYALWAPLQARGGFLRAEGALGHSIALAACLSIGSVFVLTARWLLSIRIVALVLIGVAIVVTFSRIGLVAFALGLILSIAFLGRTLRTRTRVAIGTVALVGALASVPFLGEVFSAAGSEASGSALYRIDLLSLIGKMKPLGLSSSYQVLPNGQVYIGGFQSIDSSFILIGLEFGYVPLVLIMAMLVAAIVIVARGRGNAPMIAVIAQIPTLSTVALITQLPYLLWFSAGLAVSLYILGNASALRNGTSEDPALTVQPEWTSHG
jgi:hypothetical protein